MPVIPGTPATVADVNELVRSLLNDDTTSPGWLTDAKLLPLINSAYRTFRSDAAARGISVMSTEAQATVAAGALLLELPNDFVFPWSLKEKPNGSSERFRPMQQRFTGLRDRSQQSQLIEWEYMDGSVRFVGATRDVDVLLRFEQSLPKLDNNDSQLLMPDPVNAVSALTASLAALSRGSVAGANQFQLGYQDELKRWVNRANRQAQQQPARRKPYSFRGR